MGRAGPGRPEKVLGWPDWRITGETAAAYGDVVGAIDSARFPFLPDSIPPSGGDGGGGEDQDDDTGDGRDTPKKRGGDGGAGRCKRTERFRFLAWRHEVPDSRMGRQGLHSSRIMRSSRWTGTCSAVPARGT
jgi:hypothetical protein